MLYVLTLCISALNAPLTEGQIAYVAGTEQEDRCVMLLDLSGGEPLRLGMGSRDASPRWSPDGAWLAFEYVTEGRVRLALARADGSEHKDLTTDQPWNRFIAWSPDGKRIAYVASDTNPQESTIRVLNMDNGVEEIWGGGRTGIVRPVWLGEKSPLVAALVDKLNEEEGPEAEAWKQVKPDPANTLLAIGLSLGAEKRGLSTEIFVVTRDHALPLPSFIMPSRGSYVEWAAEPHPKGNKVAFESNDGGDREIFVLTHRGAVTISNHRAADWNPLWSPIGDWLAFESFRNGRRGVYRVNPDTAIVRPVAVREQSDCWAPSWSPDGRWLVFVSNMDGPSELYLTDAAGEKLQRLTSHGGEAFQPAWRPGDAP